MKEEKHIQTSYRLLALLRVCEHLSRHLDNVGETCLPAVTGSLADCLELAGDLAGEVHDTIEKHARNQTGGPRP